MMHIMIYDDAYENENDDPYDDAYDDVEDGEKDVTDVTLVSDNTYWRLDGCDPGEWWYQSKTWLMLL